MNRLAVLIVAIGLVVAACGGKSAFDLAVGDCFDDPSSFDEVTTVAAVSCDEPHDNEVSANVQMTGGSGYPGDDVVASFADDACFDAFEKYVGTTYAESSLDYAWLSPTRQSWEERDDRTVTCIVYDAELAKLTGSVRASGR